MREGLDGLGSVVVEELAVGGGEAQDVAGFVADGEVGLDEAGGEVEGLDAGGGGRKSRGGAGCGWGVGCGGFLGVEWDAECGDGGEQEREGEGASGGGQTHGAIRLLRREGWKSLVGAD